MKEAVWKKWLRSAAGPFLDRLGRVRLTSVFAWVVTGTVLIWIGSMVIANRISRNAVQDEYIGENDAFFSRTVTDMERGIEDLTQLSYTVMSDPLLNGFLSEEDFAVRVRLLEDVEGVFNRLGTLQKRLKGIKLYDRNGVLKASTGISAPFGLAEMVNGTASLTFSGPFVSDQERWFAVTMPLYSVVNSKLSGQNGICCLQIDTDFLKERIPESFAEGEWCAIVSAQDEILSESGVRPEVLKGIALSDIFTVKESSRLVYEKKIGKTGWHMLFWVPGSSMIKSFSRLQMINLLTYLSTGVLILILFIGIYASFLRPVNRQIRFMNYYAVNRSSRMEVRSHNEMGKLAENLNAMLDDLDRLNEENLEAGRRVLEAEYQKKQSELLAYRNQINPHFLYNTFECIRGMALYYDVPDIAAISEALARFFAYNVRGKGYASIREIEEHIMDYASIIGYRFMNRYRIVCRTEEEAKDCVFPKMVLQPLVENAIFHGLEPMDREGTVTIEIRREENSLLIDVNDDGAGMNEEEASGLLERLSEYDRTNLLPPEKHGIGMVNLYRRLRVFYGSGMTFTIDSRPDQGTRIGIRVPAEPGLSGDEYVPGFFN